MTASYGEVVLCHMWWVWVTNGYFTLVMLDF
jgi:hypothetical protein